MFIKAEETDEETVETNVLEPTVILKSRSGRPIKVKSYVDIEEEDVKPKKCRVVKQEIKTEVKIEEPVDVLEKISHKTPKSTPKKPKVKRVSKPSSRCCMCQEVLATETDLITHIESLHSIEIENNKEQKYTTKHAFECTYCRIKFRLKRSVEAHVGIANYEEPLRDRTKDNERRKTSKKDQKVVCLYCGKIFANISHQIDHELRAHAESFPISCPHPGCESRFAAEYIMKKHFKNHRERRHFCHVSAFLLSFLTSIQTKASFQVCGKAFLMEKNLVSHSYLHKEIKRYQCAHCPRTFTYRTVLKQHVESHFKEKVFPCDQCEKTYKWQSDLQKHIKYTHLGIAPYK